MTWDIVILFMDNLIIESISDHGLIFDPSKASPPVMNSFRDLSFLPKAALATIASGRLHNSLVILYLRS
jgi:hypothetical protein